MCCVNACKCVFAKLFQTGRYLSTGLASMKAGRMHRSLERNTVDDSVVYKNRSKPDHETFFFSDVPYLIKTCRNCLFNSGSGRFLLLNST